MHPPCDAGGGWLKGYLGGQAWGMGAACPQPVPDRHRLLTMRVSHA